MKAIGETIARLRRGRNMTQEELAGTVGVSAQSVSKWENGNTMPDISLLPVLAEIFGVSIDTLFDMDAKKRPIDPEDMPQRCYDALTELYLEGWNAFNGREGNREEYRKALCADELNSGFLSTRAGCVYANRSLALACLSKADDLIPLLQDEAVGQLFAALGRPVYRKLLEIIYTRGYGAKAFTAASIAREYGLPQDEVERELGEIVNAPFRLLEANQVETEEGYSLTVYHTQYLYSLPIQFLPLLTLGKYLTGVSCWYYLRA